MKKRTKEEQAAYMRDYRARKKADVSRETPEGSLGAIAAVQGVAPKKIDWGRIIAPAPNDDCALCSHDQQSYHLGGPCRFPVGRRPCGCVEFVADLGFE